MGQRYLELHDTLRDRWIEFHLADGTVRDSRAVNWRRVEWEQVIRLVAVIRGKRHEVTCSHIAFKFFLCYKVVRYEANDVGQTRERLFWAIGWADGETAHVWLIDFKTGRLADQYRQPLTELAAHIHPRVQGMVAGDKPGTYTREELGYDA